MEYVGVLIYLLSLLKSLHILLILIASFLLFPVLYNVSSFLNAISKKDISWSLPFEIEEEKKDDIKKVYFPKIKKCMIILFIPLILAFFIPTKETVIAMWAVPKIINNETVHEIGGLSIDVIKKSLQNWLDNLQEIEKTKDKGYL